MSTLYRHTKLGDSLVEALDELVTSGKISGNLASEVLEKFDVAMATAMENQVTAKANFKSKLQVYRYIDNVWTFVMTDTVLRLAPTTTSAKRDEQVLEVQAGLKMVLVDAKVAAVGAGK